MKSYYVSANVCAPFAKAMTIAMKGSSFYFKLWKLQNIYNDNIINNQVALIFFTFFS